MLRKIAILVVCLSTLNGCIFVPVIDSMRQVGITESDRQRLLGERMKNYHEALSWGEPAKAMPLMMPENIVQLETYLKKVSRQERVIESKVESVVYSNDSYEAEVEVTIRSYKVPYYVVKDRVEKQVWKFSLSDGWKLFSLIELPQSLTQG